MLASLRLSTVRHALVIVLLTLSAFIAVERAHAIINGVQHALAIEHAAPGLELALANHDDGHDHAPTVGDASTGGDDQDRAPGPQHHHHSEGPQIAAVMSAVTVEAAMSRSEARFRLTDSGSPQSRIFGLDRPPKSLSDRA